MKRVREKVSNSFQCEGDTKWVSNSLKFLFLNALERIEEESIVTKRAAREPSELVRNRANLNDKKPRRESGFSFKPAFSGVSVNRRPEPFVSSREVNVQDRSLLGTPPEHRNSDSLG